LTQGEGIADAIPTYTKYTEQMSILSSWFVSILTSHHGQVQLFTIGSPGYIHAGFPVEQLEQAQHDAGAHLVAL